MISATNMIPSSLLKILFSQILMIYKDYTILQVITFKNTDFMPPTLSVAVCSLKLNKLI